MLIGPRCGPIAFVTFRSCPRMWFQATRRQHGGQPPRPSQRKSLAERRRSETRFGLLRFTKPRIGGIADASGSRRRKRPELGQPRLAQPAQRRLVRPGQRRQDHSDGTVRTRCDESPAHSRPRRWRHRWRRVRTRPRPRRPTWFSRTSEISPTRVNAPGRTLDAIRDAEMPVKRGSKSAVRTPAVVVRTTIPPNDGAGLEGRGIAVIALLSTPAKYNRWELDAAQSDCHRRFDRK
jgi:hypothetical protein